MIFDGNECLVDFATRASATIDDMEGQPPSAELLLMPFTENSILQHRMLDKGNNPFGTSVGVEMNSQGLIGIGIASALLGISGDGKQALTRSIQFVHPSLNAGLLQLPR